MASDENDARAAGISGNKVVVYVAAGLILGVLLYVGVGLVSADSAECAPKSSVYRGAFAPLRCRYKAR